MSTGQVASSLYGAAPAPAQDFARTAAYHGLQYKFYTYVQWFTSYYYWAAGVALGLATGLFQGAKLYLATVIADLFHVLDKRAPAMVEQAAAHKGVVPEPAPAHPIRSAVESVKQAMPSLPHVTPERRPVPGGDPTPGLRTPLTPGRS